MVSKDNRMKMYVILILLILLSLCTQTNIKASSTFCKGSAECFEAEVTTIIDGDTIYVGDGKRTERIRLVLVDAPERQEAGGAEATAFVVEFCPVGSTVLIDQDDWQLYDNYGRMLAVIWCNGERVNEKIIEAGYADIYYTFCDESEFGTEAWAVQYGC